MKRMFGVITVAMFLCASSALAIPAGGSLEVKTPVGGGTLTVEGSKMENINNETVVRNSTISNSGEEAETNVGTVENSGGGTMSGVTNTTTVRDSQLINEGGKLNVGRVKQ